MRSLFLAAVIAAATAGGVRAATPAVGVWATPEENGRVEVRECGSGLCGYVVDGDHIRAEPGVKDLQNRDPALRGRTLKGLPLFEGMTGGPKLWRGKVYNPVDGKIYSGSFEVIDADRVKLQGCFIYPLCKTQVWKRVG